MTETLREALERTYRERWAGTRSEKTTMSQAEAACRLLARYVIDLRGAPHVDDMAAVSACDIGPALIRTATSCWYAQGLSPATINKRLNCLSAMGISVEGCRVKNPKKLQWWLRPEVEDAVCVWLVDKGTGKANMLRLLIRWTTKTGLRIEETLALKRSDFDEDFSEVTVPGTKTRQAQATLALSCPARIEAQAEVKDVPAHYPFIEATYEELHTLWQEVRKEFGFTDPTATLKALRRSAARYLHYDRGMPLDMVRQYLRHENIETTMGYLRLTGGVSLDEQRRYLG